MPQGDGDVPGPGGAIEEMKVGSAHPARVNGNNNFARTERRQLDILGPQVTGAMEPKSANTHVSKIDRRGPPWPPGRALAT
jgi:hypothetical protein